MPREWGGCGAENTATHPGRVGAARVRLSVSAAELEGGQRQPGEHGDQLTLKYDDKIVLGTADYVAPEQVANSHAVDIRADVYALGATFYFLLAGHPPFPTGTVSQKLLWHRTKEPTPIRQVRPEVPEGLAAIITRMMAKDPKVRFQTPAQVEAELLPWVPAEVPLPSAEELPQLSPLAAEAVRESAGVPIEAPAPVASAAPAVAEAAAVGASTAVVTESRTAVAAPPPGPAPFAAPPAWGPPAATNGTTPAPPASNGSALRPGLAAAPQQAAIDTAAGAAADRTPHALPNRPTDLNPFPGGDAPRPAAKRSPWLVVAVAAGAVLAGLALAALKLGG